MRKNLHMAMIALAGDELPPDDDLLDAVRASWPGNGELSIYGRQGDVLTLQLNEAGAYVVLIRHPIPWEQIEGPCATAWYWPRAAEVLRAHPAHLLVALLDEGRDEVEKSLTLTRLAAALAQECDALGVYWGPGSLVHEPSAFAQQADQMSRQTLPLHLWIDFRIELQEGGGLRAFTTGLEALGHKELETRDYFQQTQQLYDSMFNIAHYLIDKGQVLKDGETIGLTDSERTLARHAPSMFEPQRSVIQLEFSS